MAFKNYPIENIPGSHLGRRQALSYRIVLYTYT